MMFVSLFVKLNNPLAIHLSIYGMHHYVYLFSQPSLDMYTYLTKYDHAVALQRGFETFCLFFCQQISCHLVFVSHRAQKTTGTGGGTLSTKAAIEIR